MIQSLSLSSLGGGGGGGGKTKRAKNQSSKRPYAPPPPGVGTLSEWYQRNWLSMKYDQCNT